MKQSIHDRRKGQSRHGRFQSGPISGEVAAILARFMNNPESYQRKANGNPTRLSFGKYLTFALLFASALIASSLCGAEVSPALYPPPDKLIPSIGNATYFVNPVSGDDAASGATASRAWKSIGKVNALKLAPGDKVVIAPGLHEESLKPSGEGTKEHPIVIQFLPGIHTFAVENAIRLPMYVSNSCDAPATPKPIGLLVQNVKHLRMEGGGVEGNGKTTILYAGRMVEIFNDHAEDVTYSGLVFDLKRPTVSEFHVIEDNPDNVVIQLAEGSDYAIENGKFVWKGDLGTGPTMVQQAEPAKGGCVRVGMNWDPVAAAETAEDLGGRQVRLHWTKSNYGLRKGQYFQYRHVNRDSVAVHNARSKDIVIHDCNFYALTNMGFVSQFTENITYQRVNVATPAGTSRTCPAWGDIFQFSNCKGDILVDSCFLSGMQDDAMNCHGTHLRIIKKTGDNQLLMRFMHPQTYGFAAYAPGDEVAVINYGKLREYDHNPRRKVVSVERVNDKDWLLTLDGPVPNFGPDDVLDNITWYPNLTACNNYVNMDPVRGFLVTTRGKVLIEGNTFWHCAMPGLLVEDDAEGWFESGPVRDMTIRNNKFLGCGLQINPHSDNNDPALPVHENIRIVGNYFDSGSIGVRSVKGLTVTDNRFSGAVVISTTACSDVTTQSNLAGAKN